MSMPEVRVPIHQRPWLSWAMASGSAIEEPEFWRV
jgi:hypothetical protein